MANDLDLWNIHEECDVAIAGDDGLDDDDVDGAEINVRASLRYS